MLTGLSLGSRIMGDFLLFAYFYLLSFLAMNLHYFELRKYSKTGVIIIKNKSRTEQGIPGQEPHVSSGQVC